MIASYTALIKWDPFLPAPHLAVVSYNNLFKPALAKNTAESEATKEKVAPKEQAPKAVED